jgi:hypothetical protein
VGCGNTFRGFKMRRVSENTQPVDESSELVLSSRVRLLEADPELGARSEGEELDQARKYAMLPAVHLDEGRWNIQQLRQRHAAGAVGVDGTGTDHDRCARRAP